MNEICAKYDSWSDPYSVELRARCGDPRVKLADLVPLLGDSIEGHLCPDAVLLGDVFVVAPDMVDDVKEALQLEPDVSVVSHLFFRAMGEFVQSQGVVISPSVSFREAHSAERTLDRSLYLNALAQQIEVHSLIFQTLAQTHALKRAQTACNDYLRATTDRWEVENAVAEKEAQQACMRRDDLEELVSTQYATEQNEQNAKEQKLQQQIDQNNAELNQEQALLNGLLGQEGSLAHQVAAREAAARRNVEAAQEDYRRLNHDRNDCWVM